MIQTDFLDTPPAPAAHARRSDPETSHEAAKSVTKLRERQAAVLRLFKFTTGALTDEDVARFYETCRPHWNAPQQSPSGLRTRRAELVKLGLLRWSGLFGQTESGRRTRIWEVAK